MPLRLIIYSCVIHQNIDFRELILYLLDLGWICDVQLVRDNSIPNIQLGYSRGQASWIPCGQDQFTSSLGQNQFGQLEPNTLIPTSQQHKLFHIFFK
jgi:hypothetical protein